MNPELVVKTTVLIVVSLLRLTVAIPLYFTARRNKLTNLYWLSAQFLCLTIAIPFAAAGAFVNNYIFWTFISISEIALIMFTHTTFRQGKSSPMPVFMTLAVIGLFGGFYGTMTNNFELSAWMVYPNAVIAWAWHLREAVRSYNFISTDKSAEDWVKSRYLLMIAYSIVDLFGSVLGTLLTTGVWDSNVGSIIVVLINFTSVILQILTWVMPEWFRRFLNRNQQARIEADAEAYVQAVMDIIGNSMSKETNIPKMMCFYAIRTSVGKLIKNDDSKAVNMYIEKMLYQDWVQLFRDEELHRLLRNSGSSANAELAIKNGKNALIQNQSLFTLSAQ